MMVSSGCFDYSKEESVKGETFYTVACNAQWDTLHSGEGKTAQEIKNINKIDEMCKTHNYSIAFDDEDNKGQIKEYFTNTTLDFDYTLEDGDMHFVFGEIEYDGNYEDGVLNLPVIFEDYEDYYLYVNYTFILAE